MHVLITCKYQKNRIKINQEKVETTFYPLLINGGIFRRSRADDYTANGPIWPKFELLLYIMHDLGIYKFKIDWINSNQEKVVTLILSRSRAAISVVLGLIWPNFELIQALTYVIVTCKYEKEPIINSREKGATPFCPLLVYENFFDAQGQLTR